MKVTVNGVESDFRTDSLAKFTELIELIKSSIDPEHIITEVLLDGEELSELDWASSMSQVIDRKLSITTGTPHEFVHDKFAQAASVLRECYMNFRNARKDFQSGKMQNGNTGLASSVKILHAFFEWYASIMEILEPEERSQYCIDDQIHEIADVCKKICQYQMYQSWWALGECIKNELEPKLDELEDFCRAFEN